LKCYLLRYNNSTQPSHPWEEVNKNMISAVRDEVTSLLDRLPDDSTIEDVQYHLYVIDKVRKGLESVESEGGLTQDQVEEKLSKWLV